MAELGKELDFSGMRTVPVDSRALTRSWLMSHEFRRCRPSDDDDGETYTHRFTVYRYRSVSVLECEISVTLGEPVAGIDVYDGRTMAKYAPFYYYRYGDYTEMLSKICSNIWKEIRRLRLPVAGGRKARREEESACP